jgi:hypothetical protein
VRVTLTRPRQPELEPTGATLNVQVISSRLLTSTMTGKLDLALAREFLDNLDRWVKLGGEHLIAFHDWELVEDYDTEARTLLTPWSKLHRPKFDRVHMLVRTRTLAWGISIVNSITNDVMIAHHSRAAFEQARLAVI